MKKALVIGCDGQDGSYLVPLLEGRDYVVAGVGRNTAHGPLVGTRPIDIQDDSQVRGLLADFAPDEVYYLAACHHSSEDPPRDDPELIQRSFAINTLALNNFLNAIVTESPRSRLFFAASSRVFGEPPEDVQDENTPLNPVDAYGISKTAGVHLCRYYRKRRGVFCSAGILYNHESPRRSAAFVSRKIVTTAVKISRQCHDKLVVGDLDAMVDWGYAPDYVEAMWRILQLDEAEDFVISSGAVHSVREFVQIAFESLALDWTAHTTVNPSVTGKRPAGVLLGNSARLESRTDWRPRTRFREMILEMVQAEMRDHP